MDQSEANPQTTPEQVAAAAADAKAIALAQQREHARFSALDIHDPSQPRETPPPQKPAEKPAEANVIPGATVEQTWPDYVLQAGWEMGLSSDEVKSYGSPQNFERAITLARRLSQPAPSQPTAEIPSAEAEESEPFEYPTGDDGVFTEAGAEWFKQRDQHFLEANKKHAAELAELKKQNEQLTAHLQQQQARQQEQDWNAALVNETPDEYRELIGSSLYEATPIQQQQQYRVAKTVQLMMDRAQQDGQRVPPLKTLYHKALAIEFPDVVRKSHESKVATQARDALGQFLSKPTATERSANSNPRNMTEAQRTLNAEKAVAAKMRELGISLN